MLARIFGLIVGLLHLNKNVYLCRVGCRWGPRRARARRRPRTACAAWWTARGPGTPRPGPGWGGRGRSSISAVLPQVWGREQVEEGRVPAAGGPGGARGEGGVRGGPHPGGGVQHRCSKRWCSWDFYGFACAGCACNVEVVVLAVACGGVEVGGWLTLIVILTFVIFFILETFVAIYITKM